MTGPVDPRAARLHARRQDLGLSTFDLWVRCISLGGDITLSHLRALLEGTQPFQRDELGVIEQALDEAQMDQEPPPR